MINSDISIVLNSSYGGANFSLLTQVDFTNYLWSYFLKAKRDLPETMVNWLRLLKKELSLNVKCICLYNSGENTAFHKFVQYKSEYNIKFEFIAPGTPQQNGKVERAFVTLYCKTLCMLNASRITVALRKGLWASCESLFVQLENIIVKEEHEQSASEKVYGTNPKWISNMQSFGEMLIIARHSNKKVRNKLAGRVNTVMFIGYSDTHEKDVYTFLNIAT
jgi:hypothetical protein